jgi:hypothetical protein
MRQQYLSLLLLAILLLTGCAQLGIGGPPTATPIPFDHINVQDVFNAFARAGLQIDNPEKQMLAQGRGAPTQFRDRYVFEIPAIAPNGGQIIAFSSPEQLQAWQGYIDKLRADSTTRRDVIYVYINGNILMQLSASLTTAQANAYRDALMSLS